MKSIRLLACATLVIASLVPFAAEAQTSIAEQQDARVIENLRHNGADVTKVHDIDFYLVFNRQSDATPSTVTRFELSSPVGCCSLWRWLSTAISCPSKHQEFEEHLVLNELEKKKIENAVGAFVAKRRPPAHIRKEVDLDFRIAGQSVEIYEIRPVWQGNGETHEIPIAKATFVRTRGVWQLYWQRRDLKWHSYEPLPAVRSIEDVIAEIDADPYACFWG